jgi:hypothetical protein
MALTTHHYALSIHTCLKPPHSASLCACVCFHGERKGKERERESESKLERQISVVDVYHGIQRQKSSER